jgi:hypothetical protein
VELAVPGASEITLTFEVPVQLEATTTVGIVRPLDGARRTWRLEVRAAGQASLRYSVLAEAAVAA